MIGVRAGAPALPATDGGARTSGASDRAYWIALSQVPGIGPVSFTRLVQSHGSARAAWQLGERLLQEIPRAPLDARDGLRRLLSRGARATATGIEDAVRAAGGQVVTAMDHAYPLMLAELRIRPPVLYVVGDLECLAAPTVAIVGTRRASGYGRSATAEIADELARAGATVVSGLALGIDGAAHAATLAAGGRTVAVLPSPIDRVYPPRHRELAASIVSGGGALISEIAPRQVIGKPDFARRNRVIAGLAAAVVVVEAPDRSGALLTAAAAVELGRELFAVPGPIDALSSRGCNRLIADHDASLVTSAVGLLQRIGVHRGKVPIGVESLSDSEGLVLRKLLERSGSIEELLGRTAMTTSALASTLTLLEARGLAASYGGATFHATLAARRIGRAG